MMKSMIVVVSGAFICGLPLTQATFLDLNFRNNSNITDYRQDMCNRAHGLINGTFDIGTVLEGLELTFLALGGQAPAFFSEDADGKQDGFHVDLMDIVATKAGFTYTLYWTNMSSFEPELSYTDFYLESTKYFDLTLDWAMETSDRSVLGMLTPGAFLDLSIITAGLVSESSTPSWYTSFLTPFTHHLWGLIIAVWLTTSFIYVVIERDNEHEFPKGSNLGTRMIHSTYVGFTQVCGATSFAPKTRLGKLVVISYSFFCLLVVASYTANLATFLLLQVSFDVPCDSIQDCVNKKNSFCVLKGSGTEDFLLNNYPSMTEENLLNSILDGNVFESMRQGACDNVVTTVMELDLALLDEVDNSDCKLSRLSEKPELSLLGGWIGQSDYHEKCTSVLLDSFRNHLLELAHDGKIDKQYQNFLENSRSTKSSCSVTEDDNNAQLDVHSLAGWVIIHVLVLLVSVSYSIYIWRNQRHQKRDLLSDLPSDEKPHEKGEEGRSSQVERKVDFLIDLVQKHQSLLDRRGNHDDENASCFTDGNVSPVGG